MSATWYVTEAGNAVDPAECSRKNGVLTHKSGAKIAMRSPGVPRSRSVDPDSKKPEPFGGKGDHDNDGVTGGAKQADEAPKVTEDMKPEAAEPVRRGRPYKTRG